MNIKRFPPHNNMAIYILVMRGHITSSYNV